MQTPEGSQISVAALYRYPVKGLTPEPLESVDLQPGETVPFDRVYAIENGPGRFDPEAPRHLPKITFLMLMRDERLATLRSTFDDATQTLTISRGGKPVVSGQLNTPLGRQLIEQFVAAYMKAELRGAPKIVSAPGHSFSDVAAKCVHIVNLASVRELERTVGRKVDPLRFRANVYVDGLRPWAELDWTDKEIGIGPTRLEVLARTAALRRHQRRSHHRRPRHGGPCNAIAHMGAPRFRHLRQSRCRRRGLPRRPGRLSLIGGARRMAGRPRH